MKRLNQLTVVCTYLFRQQFTFISHFFQFLGKILEANWKMFCIKSVNFYIFIKSKRRCTVVHGNSNRIRNQFLRRAENGSDKKKNWQISFYFIFSSDMPWSCSQIIHFSGKKLAKTSKNQWNSSKFSFYYFLSYDMNMQAYFIFSLRQARTILVGIRRP